MLSTEDNIFVIIITREFIIGMLGNVYIGLVNWIDWIKKKKISSIDYILTSLAISRICLLCVLILNGIIMVCYPDFYENDKLQAVINIFWTLTNYLSTWFATCLNVFYLLKIANFSHLLFLWLKRIDRVIHWILLGCLAISSLISLILATTPNYDYEFHKIINHKRNCTEMFHVSKSQYFNPLTLFNLLAIVPCTVPLISFFLLIMSLWRHIKQVKLSVAGCGDPSTEAHVRAMKTMTSFLFLLFVYYGASLLATFNYLMKESKLAVMLGEIIAILYPSGHSLILIIRNYKLRQTYIRMLSYETTVCMM
ncbi:taste receptor type 2 member 8 [Zalophus californianus]|uniref:Taste receptor type 2 n=1 Tax=Zalophus californianus TaxID=9704 RepID=A0A6J2D8I8_ZALCA|nr:taste receptor type 2 member 8 [Zalophus californianus]